MILITGGLGYLGGRIAKHLLKSTNKKVILGVRNPDTKVPSCLRGIPLLKLDMNDSKQVGESCIGVETIIHLAAMNASQCQENPEQAFMVNTTGTLNLLRSASKHKVKRIIYFSTAHVYGSPLQGRINELSIPEPKHPYSITHQQAEDHILEYKSLGLVDGIILRLSNSIGAPIDVKANCWMLGANNFSKQAVMEKKIVISGNPLDIRDFIPITSVEYLISKLVNGYELKEKILNVGSGISMTTLELSELIAERYEKLFNYKIDIESNLTDQNKALNLYYDCSAFRNIKINSDKSLTDEIDDLLLFCNDQFIN